MIVAGDIGGTKTYLAAFDPSSQGFAPVVEKRYDTASYQSPGSLLKTFVDDTSSHPSRVVLGVPGPVRKLPVRAVNLPWLIDPYEISRAIGDVDVHLLNDLQATSYGTQVLAADDLCGLNAGEEDKEGNIAVIAAGTGLGEGGLCWTGDRYQSIASEGGHSTFSPNSDLEVDLWRYLSAQHGHVSWERVVAGPGLAAIYNFLRERDPARESAELRDALEQGDRSATVSRFGLAQQSELAADALDLYAYLYGCEAGNLALKLMASGGIFVGGGIAPKILDKLRDGRFMDGFLNKGRMDEAIANIPVQVVINDKTGLLGAAYWGAQL